MFGLELYKNLNSDDVFLFDNLCISLALFQDEYEDSDIDVYNSSYDGTDTDPSPSYATTDYVSAPLLTL